MSQPINPEALAAIRRYVEQVAPANGVQPNEPWLTLADAQLLLREIERLQAQLGEMKTLFEAVMGEIKTEAESALGYEQICSAPQAVRRLAQEYKRDRKAVR